MLENVERWAVVAQLIKNMRAEGGWAGETHIQKALFFLQELLKVPSDYNFMLYKHGPYSFDLHDDLGKMRAYLVLDIQLQRPYGASFGLGDTGGNVIQRGKAAVERYEGQLEFVVGALGTKDVRTLERYGTALFVKGRQPEFDDVAMANKIIELKPHVTGDLALEAVREVAKIESDARAKGLIVQQPT